MEKTYAWINAQIAEGKKSLTY